MVVKKLRHDTQDDPTSRRGTPVNRRIPIALLEPPYLKLSVTLNSRVICRLCSGGSLSHM